MVTVQLYRLLICFTIYINNYNYNYKYIYLFIIILIIYVIVIMMINKLMY